ncbi:unnamed protein product [Protopolystoma xenopodis]|uniref:C2 NT-type domain-containing protein n=1 Tax=Protopolystoma xenopodis TaxID=117903 RepID=A0A3S4ZUM0_9PLAT|nr:unnamed protein product [Protopolystoma xenopodis]
MACVPIVSRRSRYHFEVLVCLHRLTSVPYVNAVIFAKIRLLNTRHSRQFSSRYNFLKLTFDRVEAKDHIVLWNSEHRFFCKFRLDNETSVLEPNDLKISIRMETEGGKSFHKVGFVRVNLACFAAAGDSPRRRRYILEGYDEKRKRQDNSLLLVSFLVKQTFGDTCFRV